MLDFVFKRTLKVREGNAELGDHLFEAQPVGRYSPTWDVSRDVNGREREHLTPSILSVVMQFRSGVGPHNGARDNTYRPAWRWAG